MSKTMAKRAKKSGSGPADVLFASADMERLESKLSLPAKFIRMLDRLPMERVCQGAVVAVKVHVGGNLGYTTIPPLFMRFLVEKIKKAGAKSVFLSDGAGATESATPRGYTAEVLGAPVIAAAGASEKYFYTRKMRYKTLKSLELCGNIMDADALINFSHFKGHGDCGYGAACKNLAMGCVTTRSRGQLHQLEGGLALDSELCIGCKKCVEACTHGAASWDKEKGRLSIFFHNCTYCRHCMLVCPKKAITITGGGFIPFQRGMALAAKEVLKGFDPAARPPHQLADAGDDAVRLLGVLDAAADSGCGHPGLGEDHAHRGRQPGPDARLRPDPRQPAQGAGTGRGPAPHGAHPRQGPVRPDRPVGGRGPGLARVQPG